MKQTITVEMRQRGVVVIPEVNRIAGGYGPGTILKMTVEKIKPAGAESI